MDPFSLQLIININLTVAFSDGPIFISSKLGPFLIYSLVSILVEFIEKKWNIAFVKEGFYKFP